MKILGAKTKTPRLRVSKRGALMVGPRGVRPEPGVA
jgi:hypothetical protein